MEEIGKFMDPECGVVEEMFSNDVFNRLDLKRIKGKTNLISMSE